MILRALEIADLPFLYQWENDASAWVDGDTHNPLSSKLLHDYITSSTGDIYKDGQLRLVLDDNGAPIGCVDLFDFDPRSRKAAIGMYISPIARGKGLGKEAVRLLEEYAIGFLHLHMLYAIINVKNTACRAIYEQAGFMKAGTLRDWILRNDNFVEAILYQKIYETNIH